MVKTFKTQIHEKFTEMCKSGKLFRVNLTGQQVWDLYLGSFSPEHDPVFRDPESSEHNCNHCKNFMRRYGNVVSLDENLNIVSMFHVESNEEEYANTAKVLSEALSRATIKEVFFETFTELNSLPYEICKASNTVFRLGTDRNTKRYTKEEADKFGHVKENQTITFNHIHVDLAKEFVNSSGDSVEAIMGRYRDAKNVYKRGMDEISIDTLKLVKDLIIQGSLLDGQTHLYKIDQILPLKEKYDSLAAKDRDNWCWLTSYNFQLAKFKNELIGVLCSELSEGEDLNVACKAWNKRVDPANYMKATAPITSRQIEEARKFVEENDYTKSFDRRLANINDIKVSEILHSNVGDGKIKTVSIFDNVKSTSTRHKRSEFDGIEEVAIEKFMKDILPGCTSVEALLNNSHENNLVTLTTANDPDSKPIFKWNNNYSWTFNGNLAGKSQIKEAVKIQGGKVDGVLRFSIMWAEDTVDNSDLDAHCIEPNGNTIYFATNRSRKTDGNLDIDITQPQNHKRGGHKVVENITFPNLRKMIDGTYTFQVNQYRATNSKGFQAEIEFNGELYSYTYDRPVSGKIKVAQVVLKNGEFSINHVLPSTNDGGVSKEIYGLETNKFHKVNLICLSPNHWEENNVGNKHYLFMLDECKTPHSIRSFHNENLVPDLLEHRKVMEVLGATNMINPHQEQLSGLGFNATVKDELIVKLGGNFKRTVKIKFN